MRNIIETLATKEALEELRTYTERYATLAETEDGWQRMNDLLQQCKSVFNQFSTEHEQSQEMVARFD